jgi:hypothetical protein
MRKSSSSLLILLSFYFFSSASFSSTVQSVPTKINEINSYSNFPNGDTLIQVDNPHSSCPGGYWLKMSDLSFSKNMSILLSSFHSQSKIIFYANNSSIWPHNPQAICHISQIKLVR